ncbi:MAG: type II secretion system F family protein, partial [Gammaproteobacteria bacterium]|nr:type II secretion system F family protein [Gammaproteobacteria bacterium]
MSAFDYVALDPRGRERKGIMEGDNARQIRQLLRERGLSPLSVDEIARGERKRSTGPLVRRRVGAADLALVTRQLATLVQSGMPVEEALQAVSQQTEKPRVSALILAVRARVLEGHSLGAALADFPRVFDELYFATVTAGEQSGHLSTVLERLADYTETRQATRSRVSVALFYPSILCVLALSIVALLLAYIVPQVVEVFEGLDAELPWLTQALIAVSDFIRAWGWYLLAAIAVGVWLFRRALHVESFRERIHRIVLRLPYIQRLARGLNSERFARTLSILTASGVPVLDALKIAAAVVANLPMRSAVLKAANQVREGRSLEKSLAE